MASIFNLRWKLDCTVHQTIDEYLRTITIKIAIEIGWFPEVLSKCDVSVRGTFYTVYFIYHNICDICNGDAGPRPRFRDLIKRDVMLTKYTKLLLWIPQQNSPENGPFVTYIHTYIHCILISHRAVETKTRGREIECSMYPYYSFSLNFMGNCVWYVYWIFSIVVIAYTHSLAHSIA